ncbi:MAG: capsular polysaccharide biosynthesis protein [Paracoccaceae bacterium]
MISNNTDIAAGGSDPRRLFVYNGGFLSQGRVRRILELSGWELRLGKPADGDWVGVWGKSPTSGRGETVADHTDAPVLHVEDCFLRSIHPGRAKEPPLGLSIDRSGVHFDSSHPSDLETLLASHAFDDTALLNRARDAIDRIRAAHLSKYNGFHPGKPDIKAPYVLIIDQTRGDASIEYGGANAATFAEMLVFAQTEHPGSRILIKGHPEVSAGYRQGHFGPENENDRITYLPDPASPWDLLEGATAVYTVSSQMGFEAIYAGHKPRIFGQPFYAGWGLTADEYPVARRERTLTRPQLFAGAMILYPTWYDPCHDRLCQLETAIDCLEAETRSWRADQGGYVACGMRRWKRPFINRFFGRSKPVEFVATGERALAAAKAQNKKLLVWAKFAADLPVSDDAKIVHVEDGFLRSRGLGARLIAPISLVADDLGIYYDPGRECQLEILINNSVNLPDHAIYRAERIVNRLNKFATSKYNVETDPLPDLPPGLKILVPGQVEDDASITLGCSDVNTNIGLLEHTRAANPDAIILYKPHPDVLAKLRKGKVDPSEALKYANLILGNVDPIAAIEQVDEVWTMTSTLGFEALIRGKKVTCLGVPFYAGWGLTHDLATTPARRSARPSLAGLVHACLIDYPRYNDPNTDLPCPVELVLDRLESGEVISSGALNSALSKLQSAFRIFTPLWRR